MNRGSLTSGAAFVLFGFGLGALIVAGQSSVRQGTSLRDQAIAAQRASARAAAHARELTERWNAAQASQARSP